MKAERWTADQILVYRHPVDMRKQMDGLAAIVALELDRNPTDCALYVFLSLIHI